MINELWSDISSVKYRFNDIVSACILPYMNNNLEQIDLDSILL